MMSRKFYVLFLGLCLGITTYDFALGAPEQPFSFARIEQTKIDEYQNKIEQELRYETYRKTGVAAVAVLACSYGMYRLLFQHEKLPGVVPNQTIVSDLPAPDRTIVSASKEDLIKLLKEQKETIHALHNTMATMAGTMAGMKQWLAGQGIDVSGNPDGVSRSAWLKSWLRFFARSYGMIAMGSLVTETLNPLSRYFKKFDAAVNKAIDRMFHEQNLAWFLETHTTMPVLLDQIKSNTKTYDHAMMVANWNLYSNQLTSVLGFMQYKASLIEKQSDENGKRARIIIESIISHVNKSIDTVSSPETLSEIICHVYSSVERAFKDFEFTESILIY